MPKVNRNSSKVKVPPLSDTNKELKAVSGQLLETAGTMHSFMLALQGSGFREYLNYLSRPGRVFWINLMVGIARGLGFVIGATVVVALVVWIFSQVLTQLPYVGSFFEFLSSFLSAENLERAKSGEFIESLEQMLDTFKTSTLEEGAVDPATLDL